MIRRLHHLFYSGVDDERAGQYRDHPVFISGTEYVPPKPEDVPDLMAQRAENPTDRPFNTLIADCEGEAQRDYGRMFDIDLNE